MLQGQSEPGGTEALIAVDSTAWRQLFSKTATTAPRPVFSLAPGSIASALQVAGRFFAGGLTSRTPGSGLVDAAAQRVSALLGEFPDPAGFVKCSSFSCNIDCLSVADQFTVRVPSPDGRYAESFPIGSRIRLYLRNDNVYAGNPTLMHDGIIVDRRCHVTSQEGTVLELTGADRGWFLLNCHAKEWTRLQSTSLLGLIQRPEFIDPSWGIDCSNPSTDGEINRLIRQRLKQAPQVAANFLYALLSRMLQWIQVDAGQTPMDVLQPYLRRLNLLCGVTIDGRLQLWRPNYDRQPSYQINLRIDKGDWPQNNALQCSMSERLDKVYTDVTVVGEIVGQALAQKNPLAGQNAGKVKGRFHNQVLPFNRRLVVSDGEIFRSDDAAACAQWYYKREAFDSWSATYTVNQHWQKYGGQARWWNADEMVEVHDECMGVNGKLWIQAVRLDGDMKNGFTTTLICRKPYLLQANFGVAHSPPRVPTSPPTNTGTPTTDTKTVPPGAKPGQPTTTITTTEVKH